MSEERIAQLEADERVAELGLSRDELARLVDLTEWLHENAPIFRRLSLGELAYIAQSGTTKSLERGQLLIQQGATDRVLYVLLEGQLRVWKETPEGKKRLFGYHYPGDYTGDIIMVSADARTANVDAIEESKVLGFGEEGWARISENQSLLNAIKNEGSERILENQELFEGRQLDEVPVERAHRSWVALMRRILAPIVIVTLALVLIVLLSVFGTLVVEVAISVGLAVVVAMLLWILWLWQDWRNDDYIVTSKRIIHVERILIPPFPIERQEIAIQSIQDIRITNQGIWTLLFGVQSLVIRTMGTGTIRFPDLNNAQEVMDKIFETQKRAAARTDVPGPERIRRRLAQELGFEIKELTALDTDPDEEAEGPSLGWGALGFLDYFVPRTRIETPDGITWRRHWLIMLREVLPPMLLGFLALVLVILPLVVRNPWFGLRRWIWAMPGIVLGLIAFGWYLWQYEGWRNHVYQVTDSRIIDIEGTPFHLRTETRTEGMFDVIQNVTYDSPNLLYRALRIGFVQIDTAAEESAYTFDLVHRPAEVQQEIFRRWTAYRERKQEEATRRRQQEFLDWIREYDRLVRPRQDQEG
jgi:CRP-like cAMP-binding protein